MKTSVKILSIKENKIVYRIARKKGRVILPLCAFFIITFIVLFSFGGKDIKAVGSNMGYIYDPVNSLYSDNGSIVFTSAILQEKESLNFIIPIVGAQSEVWEDGTILFTVGKSIMIKASEIGVVEDIGVSLDGVKYLKIRHSLEVYSVIENVDIVGVSKGNSVTKGQDIATAKTGSVLKFQIYYNDVRVTTLKLNQSKIVWEK